MRDDEAAGTWRAYTVKHTDKPGGVARKLRPLTEDERASWFVTLPTVKNADGSFDLETDCAIGVLVAVGFFTPPTETLTGTRDDGRTWNDAMLTIHLLRAIASRRNVLTGQCYPSYETTARDAGIPGGARHVERLAERLLFARGYLGRTYSAAKGSNKTIRFYDFSPILDAAKIVEDDKWMPTIDPPAWACNRSGAEAMRGRDCNRSGVVTIATESAAETNPSLQPNPPTPLATESSAVLATAQGATANITVEHASFKHALCLEHAPAISGEDLALKGHVTPKPARKTKAEEEEEAQRRADAKLELTRRALEVLKRTPPELWKHGATVEDVAP